MADRLVLHDAGLHGYQQKDPLQFTASTFLIFPDLSRIINNFSAIVFSMALEIDHHVVEMEGNVFNVQLYICIFRATQFDEE